MASHESLDTLIARKAAEFADQIKQAAAMADKEEEIRIAVETQLAFVQKEAGIKLEGKHEFTVASGRVDSVYDRVIIEYKNPKSPADRIGPKAVSPGTKKVVKQIKDGKKRIGIFYGAGHLPDMEERLIDQFGLKRADQRWVQAWRLTKETKTKPRPAGAARRGKKPDTSGQPQGR